MRLIDADELKKALAEMWYESAISITGVSVSELIDQAPTIEPIEDIKSCGVIEEEQNTLPSADRPHEYNLETIADIVRQLGHLDSYIADTCDRPKGKWINREDSADVFFLYKYECSVCGGKAVLNSTYCPNCGAEMNGE